MVFKAPEYGDFGFFYRISYNSAGAGGEYFTQISQKSLRNYFLFLSSLTLNENVLN